MAQRGAKFYCDSCGAEVKAGSDQCPSCGAAFSGVQCPRCGYCGNGADFIRGCPVCSYLAPEESSPAPMRGYRRLSVRFIILTIAGLSLLVTLFLYVLLS